MKVDANFSGLDEFLAEAENEIKQGMIEAAHEGVDFAKTHGEYKNHTHNLRSAPGAAVVMDGEIVDMYIPSESGHQKAKEKTEPPSLSPRGTMCFPVVLFMQRLRHKRNSVNNK